MRQKLPPFFALHLLATTCALTACVHLPPPDGRGDPVGRIHIVAGSDVRLNERLAENGYPVYSGDNVTCGPGSRADVRFPDGGRIEIAEGTDPDFRKWFDAGRCIIQVFFRYGRAYGTTGNACDIILNTDHLDAIAHTEFHVEIGHGKTILTVYRGKMRLTRPDGRVLGPGFQAVVSRSGIEDIRRPSPGELDEIIGWRQGRAPEREGWCCANGRVFHATPKECGRIKGSFSLKEDEALERCRARRHPLFRRPAPRETPPPPPSIE